MPLEAAAEKFDTVLADQPRTGQRTDQRPAVAFDTGLVLERGGEFHVGKEAARIGCQDADARIELDPAILLRVLREGRKHANAVFVRALYVVRVGGRFRPLDAGFKVRLLYSHPAYWNLIAEAEVAPHIEISVNSSRIDTLHIDIGQVLNAHAGRRWQVGMAVGAGHLLRASRIKEPERFDGLAQIRSQPGAVGGHPERQHKSAGDRCIVGAPDLLVPQSFFFDGVLPEQSAPDA